MAILRSFGVRSWIHRLSTSEQLWARTIRMSGITGPLNATRWRFLAAVLAIWLTVAVVSAFHGQVLASYRGQSQPWWPSLGYSVAVFSVWALLTPVVLSAIEWVSAARTRIRRVMAHAIALPAFTGLHVALFVILFWPVYGGQVPTPTAMARPVLLANFDKAIFAYAALLVADHLLRRARERDATAVQSAEPVPDLGLWIRSGGTRQFVAHEEIDWIEAAGDYAEVHAGVVQVLADRSLADLDAELPKDAFARIHRGAIVRLDRIRQVKPLGRGDASVCLRSGDVLRLSRRYRENLIGHIERQ